MPEHAPPTATGIRGASGDVSRSLRIAFALPSLSAGGAERVGSLLAAAWASRGHDVTVITLSGTDTDFFTLPASVRRIALARTGGTPSRLGAVTRVWGRVGAFRRAIADVRPDVVVSFLDVVNVLVLLASRGLGVPVIVSERSDPRMAPLPAPWRTLRRLTYRAAARVVVQTERVARAWAVPLVGADRVTVLPNPHVPRSAAASGGRAARIVALGRLSPEKGFDVLIDAFARVAHAHPAWTLVIHGEGDERRALEARAAMSGVGDRIALPGRTHDTAGALASAGIFVLASRFEGFPNALLEAMACGTAVVGTDCPSGPAELVQTEVDGLLVPVDAADALADALARLMADPALRARLGDAAQASAARFALPTVADRWDALLAAVVAGRRA